MHKVNTTKMVEVTWSSPKGKFVGAGKEISEELGRKPESTDLNERHPFDVEILRIPPGKAPYSYHSHSAQWEFYHVISGSGVATKMGPLRLRLATHSFSSRVSLTRSPMTPPKT
jgi:mannose-6-phosphate isomerase-like protein (cupin superfamily)